MNRFRAAALTALLAGMGFTALAQQSVDPGTASASDREPTLEEIIFAVVYEDSIQSDFNSPEYEGMRDELMAAGDKAADILIATIKSATDPMVVSSAIGLLSRVENNNKDKVSAFFRGIVSGEIGVADNERFPSMYRLAKGARNFGDPSDADYLLDLMDHEDLSVRVLSVQSLGKIGDSSTASQIKAKLAELAGSFPPEDELFSFGAVALEEIGKRHPAVVQSALPEVLDTAVPTESKLHSQAIAKTIHAEDTEMNDKVDYRMSLVVGGIVLVVGILLYLRFRT